MEAHDGHRQMSSDFEQGVAMFWGQPKFMRSNLFYYATDEAGEVVGLLRLRVNPDAIHIDQVTGVRGAGAELVDLAKAVALSLEKQKVDLCTADVTLPKYYEDKHGFHFVNPSARTGPMVFEFKNG